MEDDEVIVLEGDNNDILSQGMLRYFERGETVQEKTEEKL